MVDLGRLPEVLSQDHTLPEALKARFFNTSGPTSISQWQRKTKPDIHASNTAWQPSTLFRALPGATRNSRYLDLSHMLLLQSCTDELRSCYCKRTYAIAAMSRMRH